MNAMLTLGTVALVFAVIGALLGWSVERLRLRKAKETAELAAQRILAAAEEDADRLRKAAELAGREAAYRAKEEWEREEARRREEIQQLEWRREERRAGLDREYDQLDEKGRLSAARDRELGDGAG